MRPNSTNRYLHVLSLIVFYGLLGCKTAVPVESEVHIGYVRTTIAGSVVDEAGMPLANVALSTHGQSTISDKYGYFVLHNVLVPKDRLVLIAKQDGYFSSARATSSVENGLTEVRLNMLSYGDRTTINSATGGTIRVTSKSGIATVQLAPNGITLNGTLYSGDVRVAVRYLDPIDENFALFFPGDEVAVRESGESAMLVSYGVLQVEMRTPSGDLIQPAPDKPAELTYPVPSTLSNPPASIPLWYFDESLGMWKEEGVAVRKGNNFVGTVKHFTPWNLDIPQAPGSIAGTVLCDGRGMAGVAVRIGQITTLTTAGGFFSRDVPANTDLEVQVRSEDNDGLFTSEILKVSSISANEVRSISLPISGKCPATITGTIASSKNVKTPGMAAWVSSNGKVRVATSLDGTFSILVPSESQVKLAITSWECGLEKIVSVESGSRESVKDIGEIVVCSDEPMEGDIDISGFESILFTSAVLSPDGQKVVITGMAPVVIVRNTKTGQLSSTISFPEGTQVSEAQFSEDGGRYLVWVSGDSLKAVVIETNTGSIIREISMPWWRRGRLLPDGKHLITTSKEGDSILKYSVQTGVAEQIDLGYVGYPNGNLTEISKDGRTAYIIGGGFNYIYAYDFSEQKLKGPYSFDWPYQVTSYVLTVDGRRFVYYRRENHKPEGELWLLDLTTESNTKLTLPRPVSDSSGYSFQWFVAHPNGRDILYQPVDGERSAPRLFNFATGETGKVLSSPSPTTGFGSLSISADGSTASGVYLNENQQLKLRIWDLTK